MKKIIIERIPSFRWRGIERAAKELGVCRSCVRMYLLGRTNSISKEKGARIVIKDVSK